MLSSLEMLEILTLFFHRNPPIFNGLRAFVPNDTSGDVNVDKKVTLGDTSTLTGNLKAATLNIEEGAQFEGVCNMAKNGQPVKAET